MSTPPLTPTTFRYPFALQDQSDEVKQAHIFAFNGILDLQNAISALKSQIGPTSNTTTVVNETISGGGGGTGPPGPPGPPGPDAPPGLGGLNNQSGNASYITSMTDNGILIVFNRGAGTTVTLNSGVTTPFFFFTTNLGATGTATLTPSSGLINGAANFLLLPLHTGEVVFDGTNWTITALPNGVALQVNGTPNALQSLLNLVNGTNITITDLGGGAVQIAASTSTVSAYVPRAKTANYTAIANDVIFCDTSAGGFTITLPASASNSGAAILVKKMTSDGNSVAIARTGADLLDGATSQSLPFPFSSYTFVADGVSNWGIF